jgi:hypothetical protein
MNGLYSLKYCKNHTENTKGKAPRAALGSRRRFKDRREVSAGPCWELGRRPGDGLGKERDIMWAVYALLAALAGAVMATLTKAVLKMVDSNVGLEWNPC